jgi:hypothetical protein
VVLKGSGQVVEDKRERRWRVNFYLWTQSKNIRAGRREGKGGREESRHDTIPIVLNSFAIAANLLLVPTVIPPRFAIKCPHGFVFQPILFWGRKEEENK